MSIFFLIWGTFILTHAVFQYTYGQTAPGYIDWSVIHLLINHTKYSNKIFYLFSLQISATTSCGLTLKLLRKTPIYSDGNSVVMVTTPPGGGGNSGARSLFGGGPGMSGIRSKENYAFRSVVTYLSFKHCFWMVLTYTVISNASQTTKIKYHSILKKCLNTQ